VIQYTRHKPKTARTEGRWKSPQTPTQTPQTHTPPKTPQTMDQESMHVTNEWWPKFITWRRMRRKQDNYTPHLEATFEDYFMRFVRDDYDLPELVEDEPEVELVQDWPDVDIWRFFRGGRTTTTFH